MFGAKKTQLDSGCVLSRGLSLEKVPGITEQTILYIQPCASVQGRVNCELRLGTDGAGAAEEFFGFRTLSKIVEAYADRFAESRASSTLGAARIQWKGKKILIFQNGRIVIREALDENDVQDTLEFLSKLLAPSIRCAHCKQELTACALGLCHSCSTHMPEMTGEAWNLVWKQALARFESLLSEALTYGIRVENELRKQNAPVHSQIDSSGTQVARLSRLLLDCLVSSNGRRELTAGLALIGAVWKLGSVLEAFGRLQIRLISVDRGSNERLTAVCQMLGTILDWVARILTSLGGRSEREHTSLDEKETTRGSSILKQELHLDALTVEILGEENAGLLQKLVEK